jgi:dienelactone hydrolase
MMEWLSDDLERDIRERRFVTQNAGRRVPGLLWLPQQAPRGLVLLGHGASGHKRMAYVLDVARRLAHEHGLAAAAIDGPVHGDRRADPDAGEMKVFEDFRAAVVERDLVEGMVEDWTHALDALQSVEALAKLPVGYWGLSMGTTFGVPFVAQEPRVQAAALGLMGRSGAVGTSGAVGDRLVRDAAALSCPIFFLVQWDDELIPRPAALELFDRIGSRSKTLHANPGRHVEVPTAELLASEAFLAQTLAAP